jgi:hypothetical protein
MSNVLTKDTLSFGRLNYLTDIYNFYNHLLEFRTWKTFRKFLSGWWNINEIEISANCYLDVIFDELDSSRFAFFVLWETR